MSVHTPTSCEASPTSNRSFSSLSKFQLCFDDSHDFQLNRPVSARLRRYNNKFPNDSVTWPNSPSVTKHASLYDYSDDWINFQAKELFKYPEFADDGIDNDLDTEGTDDHSIPRSNSMYSMHSKASTTDRSSRPSRKNSFMSYCKHAGSPIRGRSISMPISNSQLPHINTSTVPDNDIHHIQESPRREGSCTGLSDDEENCARHHHRRGSVAIKFKNPEVISAEGENEDETTQNHGVPLETGEDLSNLKKDLESYTLK